MDKLAGQLLKNTKLPSPVTMVIDSHYEITNARGLRWDAPSETDYPSKFVMGSDLSVKFAEIIKSHGGRAKTQEVLAAL